MKNYFLEKKREMKVIDIAFVSLLFLLPFIHLGFGVEFTDTGYNLGNYEYLENVQMTWKIATFWSNMVGKLFTFFPLGHTWIGMKFWSTFVATLTIIISYLFFTKYYNRVIVFAGEVLCISMFWCPITALYYYLSFCILTVIIILIVKGLESKNAVLIFLAGILLSINVFVRFPNISQSVLIALVIYKMAIDKEKITKIFRYIGMALAGFVIGILINTLIIELSYGWGTISRMVYSLFSMTNENRDYKPYQMIIGFLKSFSYIREYIFVSCIFAINYLLDCFRKIRNNKIAKCVISMVFFSLLWLYGYNNRVFILDYSQYASIHFWMTLFFAFDLIFSIRYMFCKNNSSVLKTIVLANLLVVIISPLGSNNGLYCSINNMFLVAPTVIFLLEREIFLQRKIICEEEKGLGRIAKNVIVSSRIFLFFLLSYIYINCLIFGFLYVFRDSCFPIDNNFLIRNNYVLVGMRTNSKRAEIIEDLSKYVSDNKLKGKEAIYYGNIPGLQYILEMPSSFSTSWPDLPSFTNEDFEYDLELLKNKYGIDNSGSVKGCYLPVVFINSEECEGLYLDKSEKTYKESLLYNYLLENRYEEVMETGGIKVYSVEN